MSILDLKGVTKGYGEGTSRVDILKNIDLSVKDGEFVAILGFSGTGKTTLMNMLAGLEMPDQGSVSFKGAPITGPGPERGLVFQSYSLMPWLTVGGNISLAVDTVYKGKSKAERAEIVDKYINMVGLSHAKDRRPAELSGGMRQRVSVARALSMDPEVLLLDEPLSALDALTRANLQDEIEAIWQADQKTVVLITNDVDEAILLADRIIPLNPDGTLAEAFEVNIPRPRDRTAMNSDAAFKKLRADVTKYLMDVGIASKVEETRVLPDVTPIHGTPKAYAEAARTQTDERFLQFSQLDKVYPTPNGPLTVVEGFDMTLNKGEFISLIGHSGCGKSTVLTMAAGLNEISKGAIILDGKHVTEADPERAVVFQSPSLFPWLTAKENVSIGVSPKLLLLDEPFGMLDSLTRWELQEVLMEVWSRTKVTAICVTHDVDEAILLADRVVMMTNGPRATIGKIMDVNLPRPRTRKALLEHPDYYVYREQLLTFLEEYEHGHKKKEAA